MTHKRKVERKPGSGRKALMNVTIYNTGTTDLKAREAVFVLWTCPKKNENGLPCLYRNMHRWFGRDDYICVDCEQATNIKGEMPVTNKAGTLA